VVTGQVVEETYLAETLVLLWRTVPALRARACDITPNEFPPA